MNEESGRSGWSTGCLVGALLGGVLAAVLLGAAGVAAMFFYQRAASREGMVLPSAPAEAPATVEEGGSEEDAGSAEEDDDNCISALPVMVKLAGVTDKGEVRYLLDGEDEAVGNAALVAALKKRLEAEKTDPEEDLPLIVDLDVATAAGITQAQVDAAVKACWAAGASVMPPPDLSKEAVK
jgi:hypothetical protein